MNTAAKLDSLAKHICNPLLSLDIRLTAAHSYAACLAHLDAQSPHDVAELTKSFGVHLQYLLNVARDRSETCELRKTILNDTLTDAVNLLARAARNEEEMTLSLSQNNIAFSKARFSVEPAIAEHVQFSHALTRLRDIMATSNDEYHIEVAGAAYHLSELIGRSCVQFFQESLNRSDLLRYQDALLPRGSDGMSLQRA